MNEIFLDRLNKHYVGMSVLDIFQVPGTIIVIEIGTQSTSLTITIYMAYWVFSRYDEELLTCSEPWENREKYRRLLHRLMTKKLVKIWFEEDELIVSFSDGFQFNIIEDLDLYAPDRDVVRFSEAKKEKGVVLFARKRMVFYLRKRPHKRYPTSHMRVFVNGKNGANSSAYPFGNGNNISRLPVPGTKFGASQVGVFQNRCEK